MRKCLGISKIKTPKHDHHSRCEMINSHFNQKISMKKITKIILASTIFAASIYNGSQAFAKTEGGYLETSVLRAKVKTEWKDFDQTTKKDDSATGYGLAYKYAFNYNDFFLAPGIFYDHIGSKTALVQADTSSGTFSVKDRYGVKLDLGYDISDQFAVYGMLGLASVSYDVKFDNLLVLAHQTGHKSSMIGGLGLAYHMHKNVTLSLEYNKQKALDIKVGGGALVQDSFKTSIDTMKFGVAYHF